MLLMAIDDLDRISLTIIPYETDTPLIIDPDAMVSLSVPQDDGLVAL